MSGQPHVLQLFEPACAGVPTYVAGLSEGLIGRGWRVSVVAPHGNSAIDRLTASGATVLPVKMGTWPSPGDARAIRAVVEACRSNVQVIHGHSTKASWLVAIASRLSGVPSVYSPHNWVFARAQDGLARSAFMLFERTMSRVHRAVIVVAQTESEQAARAGLRPADGVHVVRTGLSGGDTSVISRDAARLRLGLAQDRVIAAWVGRRAPQKRPQDLAPLAAALTAERIQLVALGYDLEGSAEARALEAAGGRVLPRDADPLLLIAAADIYVQTSAWEATSLAVLEAMRAALPVVAYDVGGVSEQVQHGSTGYLVEVGAIDQLAQHVIELARLPVERELLGHAGRELLRQRFSFERMLDSIEAIYRRVGGLPTPEPPTQTAPLRTVTSARSATTPAQASTPT